MTYKFLRFGIEAEFLLTPRDSKDYKGNLREFAKHVRDVYKTGKDTTWPNMHLDIDGGYMGANDKIEWSLTDDESVTVTDNKQCKQTTFSCPYHTSIVPNLTCAPLDPLELVSPILHFEGNYPFRDFVNGVWKVIEAACIIETNTWCGTHVHVSPDNDYTLDQVKSVACAVLYFESSLNALVPADRLKSKFCKSFHASNPNFKGKAMDKCIALVDATRNHVAIIELMNNPDRCFAWNFQNLWDGRPLTIEFRQGPGVTSSIDALAWAEFAVTFVGAAIKEAGSYKDLRKYSANVGGLKTFLKRGVVSGVSDAGALERITGRARDPAKVEGTPPTPLDKDGERRYERKVSDEVKKAIFVRKMEEDEKARLATLATSDGHKAVVDIPEEGKGNVDAE